MAAPIFNTAQDDTFVEAITNVIGPEEFWRSEADKYVSVDSLREDPGTVITLVMTEKQFEKLLGTKL